MTESSGRTGEEQAAPDEENSSDGEADDEETASDGEADEHSDTTEVSGDPTGADVEDDGESDRAVTSPAAADSDSDQAARGGTDLERGRVVPAPASRGKSPAPDLAEQTSGGGVRVFVDLSSGSDPDSEGSSSVLASKPGVSSRRTKALEASVQIGRAHV